ncbi:polysaccharide pyruvyl transferase family protein [Amycolatopsis jiangsuensis]|uniref:Polysaccharide pyruvyl transferase WcaK-like protein n=1 Tax=Amycolatopsis jiangsuensis TaxID=1181879 RepID=A0A840ISC6_9PSEU|nr:polysaccharide pyruvyl transferase family protein [Amycolatopsis jiangsuensis]MBB4684449.1 polysaccharide pyruvyl transferase WcaK-like protein [Amycolatopsis jiangsuensis]
MTTSPARLLYVGWTGQGNLGDDAIADALLPRLTGVESWHVPHDPAAFARRAFDGGIRGSGARAVLVGGGTVVGRRNWRLLLTATGLVLARRRPWHLIGIGVEDPAFQGRNSFSGGGELGRWPRLLERFERVTVRGPRSAALLADAGVPAEVVGDPALLHEAAAVTPRDRLLGLNLGFGDDLWGHDHERVVDAVADLVRGAAADGWRARFLVINPKDEPLARAALHRSGVDGEIRTTLTVPDYLAAVGDCTVLVAERLHALVLGAVAAVPLVGLEYQPKCADFLASIGADDASVRTDVVTAGRLRGHVDALAGERDAQSQRVRGRVEDLRGRLHTELDRIRAGAAVGAR